MKKLLVILLILFCVSNVSVASNKPEFSDDFSIIRYLEVKIDAPRIMGCVQDAIDIPSDTKKASGAVKFLMSTENMTWNQAVDHLRCLYKYSMITLNPSKEVHKKTDENHSGGKGSNLHKVKLSE